MGSGLRLLSASVGVDPERGVRLGELGTPLASEDRMGSSCKGCERELSVASSTEGQVPPLPICQVQLPYCSAFVLGKLRRDPWVRYLGVPR